VCSTTLPQKALPLLVSHPEYPAYLQERVDRYEKYSNIAYETLKDLDSVIANRANGAFYMSVLFEKGSLSHSQTLPIEINEVRVEIEQLVSQPGTSFDKRFVYYLLASTGVCVVPLSSFATDLQGFRITLLERDEETFRKIFETIAESIQAYLAS